MNAVDSKMAKPNAADAFMLQDEDLFDDGAEARRHLAEGRPIFYIDEATPEGLVVREGPDGARHLIQVGADRTYRVVGPA